MPQLLALEWNGSEARLAVAAERVGRIVIEQAFSVALGSRRPGDNQAEADVGARIAAALAARGIGRIDTLVAVGRSSIELRQLSLPPGPDDELPDLVRFQAMREFNELDENWLLDFVPLGEPEDGPRSVLAAAIGPELVEQIERTCHTANLKPRRLILRACAAASLLSRSQTVDPSRLTLLVDLLSDEADLTVMIDRQVIFLRTTRLAGDPLTHDEHVGPLLAEIRRTMAAAQNRLGGRRVESIVLCGSGQPHAALAESIQKDLATPTELFDPFSGLNLGRELKRALPDHPGRFTPLLGMALAELEGAGHAIDFLHPRRRPKPSSRIPKYVAIGVAVALTLVAILAWGRWQRSQLAADVERLQKESKTLDKAVEQANQAVKAVEQIERWTATDVAWLDELRELSDKFPPAKDVVVTQLTMGQNSPRGGEITIEGLTRTAEEIGELERKLRDKSHRVKSQGNSEDDSLKHYTWRFSSSLFVETQGQ